MKVTGYSRISKELIIDEIAKELREKRVFFVAQHGGLSAASLDKLRAKLRAANVHYFVVKNTLSRRAFEKASLKGISDSIAGACGLAFSSGDPVLSSKILIDFAKENEHFKVQTGFLNGEVIGPDRVKALASLPSREVLIAKIAGGMQAPLSRFVGVLSGTMRKIVTVLDAIGKKKSSS